MEGARTRYRQWRASLGISDAELARRLGCDPSYPAKLAGARDPGLKVAASIERLTAALAGGPIRAIDWVEIVSDVAEPVPSKDPRDVGGDHVVSVRKRSRNVPSKRARKRAAA